MTRTKRAPLAQRIAIAVLALFLACFIASRAAGATKPSRGLLRVTTSSPEARQLFARAISDFENLHTARALATLREAVKKDPDFAVAHALLTFRNSDPAETKAEAAKAKALEAHASDGEKLMIRWLTAGQAGDFVTAIAAMNDLLAKYPKDIHVAWIAGTWIQRQGQYERAAKYFERALAVDPNFAGAWNEAGYSYAAMNNFDKAFAAMDKYVKLLPKEPNPQDSYAEMLRMAGRFPEALKHYRAALALDPKFTGSLAGIADTYAFMGEGDKARTEYDNLIKVAAHPEACSYGERSALTYVREGKYEQADAAFRAVAQQAHGWNLGYWEANSYRLQSMYQKDPSVALKILQQAEAALNEKHEMTQTERDTEQGLILRQRAFRYAKTKDWQNAGKTLQKLSLLATKTHSDRIRNISEGASGTVLLGQEKYAEAIPHLQEDPNDAFSQAHLALAYLKTNDTENAQAVGRRLIARHLPTMEDVLVTSEFRKIAASCNSGSKSEYCPAFETVAARQGNN